MSNKVKKWVMNFAKSLLVVGVPTLIWLVCTVLGLILTTNDNPMRFAGSILSVPFSTIAFMYLDYRFPSL